MGYRGRGALQGVITWFIRLLLVLTTTVAMSVISAQPSLANDFGGYTFNVGHSIVGERVSIRAPNSMVIASHNFALYRAVLQVDGGGLIQIGIIQTASNSGIDDCGATTSMRDYMETHAASTTQPYRCYYVGTHASNAQKLFKVAKTTTQSECTGCYSAFINNDDPRGPGEVSIAYGSNTASTAPNGSATGESVIYSSGDNSTVTFGDVSGVGGTKLQWTSLLYSQNDWHTVTASQTSCQNTDDHFNIETPYGSSFFVHRSIGNGPC